MIDISYTPIIDEDVSSYKIESEISGDIVYVDQETGLLTFKNFIPSTSQTYY